MDGEKKTTQRVFMGSFADGMASLLQVLTERTHWVLAIVEAPEADLWQLLTSMAGSLGPAAFIVTTGGPPDVPEIGGLTFVCLPKTRTKPADIIRNLGLELTSYDEEAMAAGSDVLVLRGKGVQVSLDLAQATVGRFLRLLGLVCVMLALQQED